MDFATAEVRELVEELENELSANYAPEQRHGLSLDRLFEPHVRFYIARLNGTAVACGGIARFEDFAELKRMYVRPNARGQGIADAIVQQLSEVALEHGLTLLKLETGTLQTAAIRFYQRCGFLECPPFEPYTSMPPDSIATSYFMEKQLDPRCY